jgi:hypothetical protein
MRVEILGRKPQAAREITRRRYVNERAGVKGMKEKNRSQLDSGSIHLKQNSGFSRNVQQIVHHGLDQWNAFFASNRFGFALRIAGDQRAVDAGRRLGIAEDVNPFVDCFWNSSLSIKPSICWAPKKWPSGRCRLSLYAIVAKLLERQFVLNRVQNKKLLALHPIPLKIPW